ncbi:MAG: hypothetical protein RL272_1221 [Candidatus Parcubacteria bacterium]|jgi:general stress protein 26
MPANAKIKEELIAFLRGQLIAVVSTATREGKPESAAIFYWVNDVKNGDFSLYFVTRGNTRKMKNLLFNDEVAVVIGAEFRPSTVQIQGKAEILESADNLKNLTQLAKRIGRRPNLAKIYAGEFFPRNPFGQIEGENFVVVRVRPTWVRWMRFDQDTKKLDFHQIIG